MTARGWRAAALGVVAVGLLLPATGAMSTQALFIDTDASLSANTVASTSCTSTTWADLITSFGTANTLTMWQRLGSFTTSGSTNTYTSSSQGTNTNTWSSTNTGASSSGALYCSSDTGVNLNSTSDKLTSQSANLGAPTTGPGANPGWNLNSGTDTMSLWFRGTSASAGALVSVSTGSIVDRVLWLDSSGNVTFGARNSTSTCTSSRCWTIASSGTNYSDGLWHLATVAMGISSNAGATLYVDGVQKATTSSGAFFATTNSGTSSTITFGQPTNSTGPTNMPTVSYLGDVDEFVLNNGALTAAQLRTALPVSITSASITPTTTSITSATVGTSKAFTSAAITTTGKTITGATITPNATISSATSTPQATISSAKITPSATMSSASISPVRTLTAITVNRAKTISSLSVAKNSRSVTGTTSTTNGFVVGQSISISISGNDKFAGGTITSASGTSFAYTESATLCGTNGGCSATSGTATSNTTFVSGTTSASNGFAASDVITLGVPSSVTNYTQVDTKSCTVATASGTSFTCNLSSAATSNVSGSSLSGTATRPETLVSVTTSAAHGFATNDVATFAVPSSVSNYTVLDTKTCTIASVPTTTTFTCNLAATTSTNISATSGTATVPQVTVSVTTSAAHGFNNGDSVTIAGTGSSALNGTFTVANASGSSFTYDLGSSTSTNVSVTTGTATVPRTLVSVTTSAAHGFTTNDVVTFAIPSTVTNYTVLDTKTCNIASTTSTTFTCNLAANTSTNISAASGTATVPKTTVTITSTSHGYTTGDKVTISGVNAALNGDFIVTNTGTNTFTYPLAAAYSGANISATSGTATKWVTAVAITGTGMSVAANEALVLTGTNKAALDNRTCTVASSPTPSATAFTCNLDVSTGTAIAASPAVAGSYLRPGTTVTVVAANTMTTSDTVTITGAGAPFDGTFAVASASSTQFTYTVSSNPYKTVSVGSFTPLITLATIVTDSAHGLSANDSSTISGAGAPFDGTCTVVTVTDSTHFTCDVATATDTAASATDGILSSATSLYSAGSN